MLVNDLNKDVIEEEKKEELNNKPQNLRLTDHSLKDLQKLPKNSLKNYNLHRK